MNNYFKFLALAACTALTVSMTSCSDDNDEPNKPVEPGMTVETVFPEGVPANVDGATITTNDKGQVVSIVDESTKVSFKYGKFSRATEFDVLMEIRDTEYPDDRTDFYMQLNEQGYVKYALEIYDGDDTDTDEWWFEYNAAGQLTYLKRSEGDNEVSRITYTDGNATLVTVTDDEDPVGDKYHIAYTSDAVKTAIANKGGLMMFDNLLNVDMDEMEVAYYAGLLSTATRNLPVAFNNEDDDNYYMTYSWDLNAAGLPVKLTSTYWWDGGSSSDVYTFAW